MKAYQKLSHTCWDCKYHVVYIPKRRKKRIFGQLRRDLGGIFHELAAQRSCEIVEGHLMSDHERLGSGLAFCLCPSGVVISGDG